MTSNGALPVPSEPALDLATLLSHFLALRQEINLQTRAVRSQQEQNSELLNKLGQSVEALTRSRSDSEEEKPRPMLTTLIEVYDALLLANREVTRTREQLLPLLEQLRSPSSDLPVTTRSLWARWFGTAPKSPRTSPPSPLQKEQLARLQGTLTALLTGYSMSLERLDRALGKHGLQPIQTVGLPFNPDLMEAVDIVTTSDRPNGEVVEELRRGYLWQGRVFRFAQVRVARH